VKLTERTKTIIIYQLTPTVPEPMTGSIPKALKAQYDNRPPPTDEWEKERIAVWAEFEIDELETEIELLNNHFKRTGSMGEERIVQSNLNEANAKLAKLKRKLSATAVSATAQPETKEQRQDRRLKACEDAGLVMPASHLRGLPYGVGAVAEKLGITRQALSTDVKAALKRREAARKEGLK
jgi:hypothetical protein